MNMEEKIYEMSQKIDKLEQEMHKITLLLTAIAPAQIVPDQEKQNALYELATIREQEQQTQELRSAFK